MAKSSNNFVGDGLGVRVRARREELGLSRRALDDGRLSQSYVARIEDGSRTPSLEALVVLAELLDTTALYLLTGDDLGPCLLCRRLENGRTHGR